MWLKLTDDLGRPCVINSSNIAMIQDDEGTTNIFLTATDERATRVVVTQTEAQITAVLIAFDEKVANT